MRFRDSLNKLPGNPSIARRFCAASILLAILGAGVNAQPQAVPAASSAAKPTAATPSADTWLSLSTAEKASLAPLEKSWDGLSAGQKRKWLAIAKTYPGLGTSDQEKLHSRMVEWAALSPKDREVARLNFAQSKTLAKSDRAANWEAYQALSPEEREKLAQGAKIKPVGAAVAVKPVAPERLTAVPVTRHTPEAERSAAVLQRPINRSTLLPQLPASAATPGTNQPLAAPSKP